MAASPEYSSRSGQGIGLVTCLSLVMATMVGTGVYTSLGYQLEDLASGFSILVLWALGGLISLCGALCYAELAVAIPRSGGEYTYLSEIYHPSLGFMAAFISVMAGFAAPIALSAIAFGTYLHAVFPWLPERASAFLVVILISAGHLRSVQLSKLVQNGMTAVKFLLVGSFLLIGLWNIGRHPDSLTLLLPSSRSAGELLHPDSGIALIFVLYSYSGWNASSYLAGEVLNSQRTVGLSLVIGTLLVVLLYLLLNAVFLTAAPVDAMRGVLNVGSVAAGHLLGSMGGAVMSGIIALGLLASLSAMIWAGPRVTQRVGDDHPPFRMLSLRNGGGIPVRATLLQLLLVLILIATGSFENVLLYAQIPLLLCLILGVAGIFVLRGRAAHKTGGIPRIGFRCPLYPLTPLLFIFCSLAALIYSALNKPWPALAGLGTIILPLALYPWIASRNPSSS